MASRRRKRSNRFEYLQQLVTEFQKSNELEMKQQIVANLANFAYDPSNYGHFETLNVMELFVDVLDESDDDLIEFAIGGICNCVPDPRLHPKIAECEGLELIVACLSSSRTKTIVSTITSLIYLLDTTLFNEINTPAIKSTIQAFRDDAKDPSVRNTAQIFLTTLEQYITSC